MMKVHYLQHVPFEGLGSIEPWLIQHGYTISATRFYVEDVLPEVDDIDFLIVLGGPMSVKDEAEFPWLVSEKRFVREAITRGKAVLGVCLGAQMIAETMGGQVYKNKVKEIGWFPIQGIAGESTFCFPTSVEVFHWHGETFDLPPATIQLARSAACENQAFQLGRNTIGLQFHLETTPHSAKQIVENCRAELVPGPNIQSEQTILSVSPKRYTNINTLMAEVLTYLHQGLRHAST